MDKHILEFIDDRLTVEKARQCALQLVLAPDSVSMMASDSAGEILALQSWQAAKSERSFDAVEWDIRRMLKEEPVMGLPFGHIFPVVFHRNTTLVPRRLFQHSAIAAYFKLLLAPAEYQYTYDELPEFDAYLISATQAKQAKLFAEFFPQQRIRHQAVPLLRFFRELAQQNDHSIFVHFRHQVAQIAVFERQNLLFYNSFTFIAAADLLYYVLLAYDQFRLNPRDIPLDVAGSLLEDSEVYRMLYRFVREIRFVAPSKKFHLPRQEQALPDHCHVELFCLTHY